SRLATACPPGSLNSVWWQINHSFVVGHTLQHMRQFHALYVLGPQANHDSLCSDEAGERQDPILNLCLTTHVFVARFGGRNCRIGAAPRDVLRVEFSPRLGSPCRCRRLTMTFMRRPK